MELTHVLSWGEVPLVRVPIYYPDAFDRVLSMLKPVDVGYVRDVLNFLKNPDRFDVYISGGVLGSSVYGKRRNYSDVDFSVVSRHDDGERLGLVQRLKQGDEIDVVDEESGFPKIILGSSRFLVGYDEFRDDTVDSFRLVPLQGRIKRFCFGRGSVIELNVWSKDNFDKLYRR